MGKRQGNAPREAHKICPVCARRFEWRKAWAAVWDQVVYCSTACQRLGLRPADLALEARIHTALTTQPAVALAALLGTDEDAAALKRAARRLAVRGELVIFVDGRRVDPDDAKGQWELRRPKK